MPGFFEGGARGARNRERDGLAFLPFPPPIHSHYRKNSSSMILQLQAAHIFLTVYVAEARPFFGQVNVWTLSRIERREGRSTQAQVGCSEVGTRVLFSAAVGWEQRRKKIYMHMN